VTRNLSSINSGKKFRDIRLVKEGLLKALEVKWLMVLAQSWQCQELIWASCIAVDLCIFARMATSMWIEAIRVENGGFFGLGFRTRLVD
jgi:hypothetical protein